MSAKTAQNDYGQIEDEVNNRIEYSPTDSEIEAARDVSIHADHVAVEPSLGDAHKTVRERVEAIVDAANENGVLQEVTVEEADGIYHAVTINIQPLENWNVKGQRGFDSAHILLGVNGGLEIGNIRSLMTDGRSYDRFRRLKGAVSRMS